MIPVFEDNFALSPDNFLLQYVGALPTQAAVTGIAPEVNHGRWIVKCPYCPSAQMASATSPRFFCVECQNAGAGGKWLPVLWPANRKVLEGILLRRPHMSTRNWNATETAQDLTTENVQAGVH